MDLKKDLGFTEEAPTKDDTIRNIRYINLKLASMGLPIYRKQEFRVLEIANDLISNIREKNRLLHAYLCPADQRIQNYLNDHLADTGEEVPRLPGNTFILDHHGLAREMSLAPDKDEFITDIVESYRIQQGVLHNPKHDRRTTKGVFHVAEGGLPVPHDKKAVPKITFQRLLACALNPPKEIQRLPFTSTQDEHAETFVTLMLRPLVCPEVKGIRPRKKMEVRFFAPGNMVSNLDFVESIFGNAGDPYLPDNDAGLDVEHWSGHTGCVILAPQMLTKTKKELGLPHISDATDRQKRDAMCYEKDDELYNDGTPFKITCRNEAGVVVTLIADNYFGYCKKEVKTQIGYAANLMGLAEEEHAGGAQAFPRYNLGDHFMNDSFLNIDGHNFADGMKLLADRVEMQPEGHAVDKNYPKIVYLPDNAEIDMNTQEATWEHNGKQQSIRVLPSNTYVHPTGYKIDLEKHPGAPSWRLVGTQPEGSVCHKPCTVSGGGKSEISKALWDAIHFGPVFVAEFEDDMDAVEAIISKDYSARFKAEFAPDLGNHTSRKLLDTSRSLGSVIKMLTPSTKFTDDYNAWLKDIPNRIKALVFMIKRFYKEEWQGEWRKNFGVDIINGEAGHEFKFGNRKLVGSYLRMGLKDNGAWWTCKLRQDFMPSSKIQWEDDISASIVMPTDQLEHLNPEYKSPSIKITENCEYRFFQRPDEAINRGYDKQAEKDLAGYGNFISNFEPLQKTNAEEIMEKAISFHAFSAPMQEVVKRVVKSEENSYFVSSSHPRIFDGAPTKNPRYLQKRPDLLNPQDSYLAEVGIRLQRKIPANKPVHHPVNCVLPGRRNNPAEHKAGIRPLAVYNPVHYQELPELFMDFVSSLTGKSPSTTGAGSEGALTKGPFNALVATSDLNNALLAFILTGANGFTTAAGYVGPNYRVDHDISLFIPELWARMTEEERDPHYMIENGFLEKVEDFDHNGEKILGSRLGYRITKEFVNAFLGRIFDNPDAVFNTDMLKPETQSQDDFVDGIKNVTEAQERVAKGYLEDGSVEGAIEPLKALIHIMATGAYNGKTVDSPEVRKLFERDYVINSDWYKARLKRKQAIDIAHYEGRIKYLEAYAANDSFDAASDRLDITSKLDYVKAELARVSDAGYPDTLVGTIGADVLYQG